MSDTPFPKQETPQDIAISGRFDQYRSSYWAAAVAVLPIRYMVRPFLRKHWDAENSNHFDKHKYSGLVGLFMNGVTSYYATRTFHDMKSVFAQTLAWEMNKDPSEVTFSDFRNSKNSMIQETVENYISYNTRRFAVNSTFFLPYVLQPLLKNKPWFKNMHPETGVDLGVAANAAYLFSDVLSRKITPFEELQSLIDRKINQSDHFTDQIHASDLIDVYERHAAEGRVKSFLDKRGTSEWADVQELFDRMADLINQTYKNVTPHEHADFGFPQFIYLVGNGLINPDKMEQSKAIVEIANSHGIAAVKTANKELRDGKNLNQMMEQYSPPGSSLVVEGKKVEEPAPSTALQANFKVQPSGMGKSMEYIDKSDMGLAFQEKIRHQAQAASEGLAV